MTFAELDINKTYTYADYFKWKFEERVELIRGRVFEMSPAPNRYHQQLSVTIVTKLSNFLDGRECEVYSAPFDVRLPRKSKKDKDIITVLQPDICVICDPSKLDERGCIGAPDIVIEILSPGNSRKELKNKYDVYEEAGVKEYWIVSPPQEAFIVYTLAEGRYSASRLMGPGDTVTSSVLAGFSLDLEKLFSKKK